jgi:hypothetical protein
MVSLLPNSQNHLAACRLPMTAPEQPEKPKPERSLPPEAERALAEAETRRRLLDQRRAAEPKAPKEVGGRDGPDPTRYGDWEKDGIASDF